LRFPAAFCGIYGFKPTQTRITFEGDAPINKIRFSSDAYLRPTSGPMGSSVDDLILGMKIFCDENVHHYDPITPPLPWRSQQCEDIQNPENFQHIKIGVLTECEFLPLSKAVKRAMEESADAARRLGFQVVPFTISEQDYLECNDAFMAIVSNTGADEMVKDMKESCETLMEPIREANMIREAGWFMRKIIDFFLWYIANEKRQHRIIKHLKLVNSSKYELEMKKGKLFCERFAKKWQEAGITALIAPQFPTASLKLESVGPMGLMLLYSIFWNITGYPSGVIPVTKVREDE